MDGSSVVPGVEESSGLRGSGSPDVEVGRLRKWVVCLSDNVS